MKNLILGMFVVTVIFCVETASAQKTKKSGFSLGAFVEKVEKKSANLTQSLEDGLKIKENLRVRMGSFGPEIQFTKVRNLTPYARLGFLTVRELESISNDYDYGESEKARAKSLSIGVKLSVKTKDKFSLRVKIEHQLISKSGSRAFDEIGELTFQFMLQGKF